MPMKIVNVNDKTEVLKGDKVFRICAPVTYINRNS